MFAMVQCIRKRVLHWGVWLLCQHARLRQPRSSQPDVHLQSTSPFLSQSHSALSTTPVAPKASKTSRRYHAYTLSLTMRLINTTTLQLEEFFDKALPKYAILSHTWGQNEVTLADYKQRMHGERNLEDIEDDAVSKIRGFCRLAAADRHSHGWVDTCCIDKKSSAELSEAINSMYHWYRDTRMCYIYLNDVSKQVSWHATAEEIHSARWFTRGWTLQELLRTLAIQVLRSTLGITRWPICTP
jgi:hypothetical protein